MLSMVYTPVQITITVLHRSESDVAFVSTTSFLLFQLLNKKRKSVHPILLSSPGNAFPQLPPGSTMSSSVRTHTNFINNSTPKFHHLRHGQQNI